MSAPQIIRAASTDFKLTDPTRRPRPAAERARARGPGPSRPSVLLLLRQQVDGDVGGRVVDLVRHRRSARAVVRARAAGDGEGLVVRVLRHEALNRQRTLRQLDLDVAQALLADERANAAVDAGVVTGHL